ncbi:MAG: sulfatase [Thermoanaerobaculia bacterium]
MLLAACRTPPSAPAARNLIVVVIDTLRQDRVGAYGERRPTTPTLDRLASAGAVADGLSPAAWTRPATATILTGLHPLRHRVLDHDDHLPREIRTLAQRLEERGFATLAISSNPHVAPKWGFRRGFHQFLPAWDSAEDPRRSNSASVNRILFPALATLRPPFFLYVHYLDPHQPYDPPRAYDGSPLPPELRALAPLEKGPRYPILGPAPPELVRAASDLYDGEVRANDAALGELLERLHELRLEENTLIVVTADHGEAFFEHGRSGHGHMLDAEVTRVPLLWWAPGVVAAGGRFGTMGLADIVPTALRLLGVGAARVEAAGLDGLDQSAALRGLAPLAAARHLLFVEGEPGAIALLDGPWKLLLGSRPYRKSLYALEADPGERRDLAAADGSGATLERLARELAEDYNRLRSSALQEAAPERVVDAELERAIAALGYERLPEDGWRERVFPARLRAADGAPTGLRGWEEVGKFASCVTAPEDRFGQLLAGWCGETGEGEDGRAIESRASFAMPSPGAVAGTLTIEGINATAASLPVTLRDRRRATVWSGEVGPGPFTLRTRTAAPEGDRRLPVLLSLETAASHRGAGPLASCAESGLRVRRICLAAAPD